MNTVSHFHLSRVRRVTTFHGFWAAICLVGSLVAAPCCIAQERTTLKDAFADDFRIGAAVDTYQILGQEPGGARAVAREFNSITSENLFKWEEVEPEPGKYDFGPADQYVEFGNRNGMFIVGHNLIWHAQTPDWVFEDEAGNPVDRNTLLVRMRDHIYSVVGRYKGRVDAWDVVNEPLDDDGGLRKSRWQQIIGDDYVEKALQFAHEADPSAELYVNDYGEWDPVRRKGYIELIRRMKSKGAPISGIGLQGHWGLDYPSIDEIETMLSEYSELGVKVMITELDMNLLPESDPNLHDGKDISQLDPALDPYADGLPDDVSRALADRYAELFACFLRHRDKIDRVTFWGVEDGQSWLNNWPITGRTSYPLLFDRQLQPKPALDAVLKTSQ